MLLLTLRLQSVKNNLLFSILNIVNRFFETLLNSVHRFQHKRVTVDAAASVDLEHLHSLEHTTCNLLYL